MESPVAESSDACRASAEVPFTWDGAGGSFGRGGSRARHFDLTWRVDANGEDADERIEEASLRLDLRDAIRTLRSSLHLVRRYEASDEARRPLLVDGHVAR